MKGLQPGRVVGYKELLNIPIKDNGEDIVPLPREIHSSYNRSDMLPITGEKMYVRETVVKKLLRAQEELQLKRKDLFLKILYGYRHPDIQKKYFEEMKNSIRSRYPNIVGDELDGIVHNSIAVPSVAGHPTGGAVDLTLATKDGDVWMGSAPDEYSDVEKMRTFSKYIGKKEQVWRLLLHDVMKAQGFAPFYGEWWHFSYGDREWAFFYAKEHALYDSKDFYTSCSHDVDKL